MITKELDRETEQLLAEILEQENTTSDELIRTLIRDRWLSLRQQAVELPIRTTDSLYPESTVQKASATLSPLKKQPKQKNSKQMIADFMKRKRFY